MSASATRLLPDVGLTADLVCDAELALLGVHGDAHLLGAALGRAPIAGEVRSVRLVLDAATAHAVLTAGGAVLRDDEWTPFAQLTDAREVMPTGDCASSVVSGVLEPLRDREAGFGRTAALSPDDAARPGERLQVVVLRRPVVDDEARRLAARARSTRTLLLVPGGPTAEGDVPAGPLLQIAEQVAAGWSGAVSVRVAPLAWRDPASDVALVERVGTRLGAQDVHYLRSDDGSPDGDRWRAALAALDAGRVDALPGLEPAIETVLRVWRPPRAHRGLVLMFTGLSGSGKSTLARGVTQAIRSAGRTVSLLDGDVVRHTLSSGLGFDRASRERNVERIGFVAAEVARHGGVAVCAPIAPYEVSRAAVRGMAREHGDFVLVHVSTPIEECERRDLKGLYAKARAGLISEFTGVSDPYEVPSDADLSIDTSQLSIEEATRTVLRLLSDGGWLSRSAS